MRNKEVILSIAVSISGKGYLPGEKVALSEKEAEKLLAAGRAIDPEAIGSDQLAPELVALHAKLKKAQETIEELRAENEWLNEQNDRLTSDRLPEEVPETPEDPEKKEEPKPEAKEKEKSVKASKKGSGTNGQPDLPGTTS